MSPPRPYPMRGMMTATPDSRGSLSRRRILSTGSRLLAAGATAGLAGSLAACSQSQSSTPAPSPVSSTPPPLESGKKPNIILVMLDDAGYGDLVPELSQLIETPRIDRFIGQGMNFTQMYAGSSTCTPSRAALLTGRYAPRVGLPWVLQPWDTAGLSDYEKTIPEILRNVGYRTGIFGKWHLGSRPRYNPVQHGFDHYVGLLHSNDQPPVVLYDDQTVEQEHVDQSLLTRRYTDEAIKFVERNKDDPFFLYLPHSAPHVPLFPEKAFADSSPAGEYGDVLKGVDFHFGRLLDKLDELGLSDNTIVMFTSDNGPWFQGSAGGLRGRKTEEYEGGIRVPFYVRWPRQIRPGSICDSPACFTDLLPTLTQIAGTKAPTDRPIDGIDISSVFKENPMPYREALYFFHGWALAAVRSGVWKLHIPEQNVMHREYLAQLFNVHADPYENYDLSSENPRQLQRLRKLATSFAGHIATQQRAAQRRAGLSG